MLDSGERIGADALGVRRGARGLCGDFASVRIEVCGTFSPRSIPRKHGSGFACLEQNASSLSERSYALRYDVRLNERGDVVDSRLRTSNLQNTDAQGCISRVIAAMSVPDEAIQMRSRPVSGGERMMREQRATLNSESENPLVFLAPWVIEAVGIDMIVQVGVGIIAAIGTIATSPKRDECQERYMDCLMTDKGSQWGSVPKHSVCLWCRDSCKGNGGVWPASVPGMGKRPISCEY